MPYTIRDTTKLRDFLRRCDENVTLKSAVMEFAAREAGFTVERLTGRMILVGPINGRTIAFNQMNGHTSSHPGKVLCDQKHLTRSRLAAAGIPVPQSEVFWWDEYDKALQYFLDSNRTSVVKPASLARGKGITTDVRSTVDFEAAWRRALSAYNIKTGKNILVEEQVPGEDFRLFVVGTDSVFATQRKRAHVVGNGESTIRHLIEEKNSSRRSNPYLKDFLIPTEESQLDRLPAAGRSLETIPANNVEIELRGTSNLSAGGDSIDLTNDLHSGFRDLAIDALTAIPGMQYAGVDVISPSITEAPKPGAYVVTEVEYAPAPITYFPVVGAAFDMAAAIMHFYIEHTARG